jgi:hypothetical protein
MSTSDAAVHVARAVFLTVSQAANFHRRIYQPVNSFPLLLAWMLYQPHDVSCGFRKVDCLCNVMRPTCSDTQP